MDSLMSKPVTTPPKGTRDFLSREVRQREYVTGIIREVFSSCGFSPLETLMCATKTGAEIMGRGAETGTLASGKLADVLVVDGDVVGDITILEDRTRLLAVLQGGVIKAGRLASARANQT